MYKVLNLNTWEEYLKIVPTQFKQYVFRGQQDSNWILATSYERSKFEKIGITEEILREKFIYMASSQNYIQLPNTELELLALMQHFGVPTRLLDFSYSPFIAAYFAFEPHYSLGNNSSTSKIKMVSIWAINYTMMAATSFFKFCNCFPGEERHQYNKGNFDDDHYHQIKYSESENLESCFFCSPIKGNIRLTNQQGLFLSHNSRTKTLHEVLVKKEKITLFPDLVYQINIPVEETTKALKYLFKMNIRPSILFPGLEEIAKEIAFESDLLFNRKEIMTELQTDHENFMKHFKNKILIID